MNEYEHYVGTFDFKNYNDIIAAISSVLSLTENEVHIRLFYEALQCGWNVSKASKEYGVTPHIYNETMESFYKHTDAFVFELLVEHQRQYCKEVDRRVVEAIETIFPGRKKLQILTHGDGIGSDSLRFSAMGHEVTYFEFQGHSANFAKYRFKRLGLNDQIKIVHDTQYISKNNYDIVVSREVLEHVPNPFSTIEMIRGYLRDGGVAIISEAFGMVEPYYPTHLLENKQYQGKTECLFRQAGFLLAKGYPEEKPMVFKKIEISEMGYLKNAGLHSSVSIFRVLRQLIKRPFRRLRYWIYK